MESAAHSQPKPLRREAAHYCLLFFGVEQIPVAHGVLFAFTILDLEQVHRHADQSVALVIVPNRNRHRCGHATVAGDQFVLLPCQVARRCLKVKNGVEHELKFGTTRTEHAVETGVHAGEVFARLILHHPDTHQQPARQRNRKRGDHGGQHVLPQASQDDLQQAHG